MGKKQFTMKKLSIIPMLLLAGACMSAFAGQPSDLFEKKDFVYKGDTLHYRILYPEHYDPDKKYPFILFLHGAGERGSDNESQLKHGSFLFTSPENRNSYPAIVVFPQCPADGYWAPMEQDGNDRIFPENPKPTPSMRMVEQLVRHYMKQESVDRNRMYILGLSMGGMGTFDYICRHPKQFACAIPICGGVHLERLKKVRHMPIRIYHGSVDPVVSVEFSRNAFIELKALGSEKVEYKEYTGVEHDSWNNAFAEPDFLEWMFRQTK